MGKKPKVEYVSSSVNVKSLKIKEPNYSYRLNNIIANLKMTSKITEKGLFDLKIKIEKYLKDKK